MNGITKMVLVATIICSFSAAWLGALNKGLEKRIQKQEDYFIRGPAIMELLEGCPNDPLTDRITLKKEKDHISIYPWVEAGKVRRVALEGTGRGGYGGDIIVISSVDLESNRIRGVRVTQHKETPGVGTRAMEPSYLNQYVKLSIKEEIKLKKEGGQVDAITGASLSSAAIADAVDQSVKFVTDNKERIIKAVLKNKGIK